MFPYGYIIKLWIKRTSINPYKLIDFQTLIYIRNNNSIYDLYDEQ